ncbi:MAG: hypothetical protein KJ958_12080 [Gammaproteobacteria bacterium]|nr:hypothetical protein [Gammaproteobacteria bacterium]MBU1979894.1 hypothetical protein [Gammaproteobacteria bacterium]
MRIRTVKWLVIPLVISLSACGSGTWLNNRFSIDDTPPSGLVLDARHRVILVTDKSQNAEQASEGNNTEQARKDNNAKRRHVVCAEPSPDVFALFAATGGLTLGQKDTAGSGNVNAQLIRSMANIARRTATTQLLRDGLYRACEAYMNGVISHEEYRNIVMGYDEILITLVALEGLAGSTPEPEPPLDLDALAQKVAALKHGSGAQTQESASNDTPATSAKPDTSAPKGTVQPKTDQDTQKNKSDGVVQSATLSKEAVEGIKQVVRNYYCFQLTLKKLFYGNTPRRRDCKTQDGKCENEIYYDTVDQGVLNAMCEVGVQPPHQNEVPTCKSDPPPVKKIDQGAP